MLSGETTDEKQGLWVGLSALANPVRLRIISMLQGREQCVCHLTEALGLSQGTISYHMGLLKHAGLVEDRHDPDDARWVYYRLNPPGIAALQATLGALLDTSETDTAAADCCGSDGPCDDTC